MRMSRVNAHRVPPSSEYDIGSVTTNPCDSEHVVYAIIIIFMYLLLCLWMQYIAKSGRS